MSERVVIMQAAGRIEQVGTPKELYSRPRTEFAASFPGKSNFLRRESRVWALRPEKIDMTPQTARTMGKTTGRVVSMTYFGPLLKYLVAPP